MKSHKSRILAHRGHWKNESGYKLLEKNSLEAISRAANLGFGIETDIRDFLGEIVVSHDPVTKLELSLHEIFKIKIAGPVALNVKSDGLAPKITTMLKSQKPNFEIFFFDMSTPEYQNYLKHDLRVASRISEYDGMTTQKANSIWLDSFTSDWYIDNCDWLHSYQDKNVIIVSPELHKRSHLDSWNWISKRMNEYENLSICTDSPLEFLEYWQSQS